MTSPDFLNVLVPDFPELSRGKPLKIKEVTTGMGLHPWGGQKGPWASCSWGPRPLQDVSAFPSTGNPWKCIHVPTGFLSLSKIYRGLGLQLSERVLL